MTTANKARLYDQVKAVNNATINVDTAEGIVEAFAAAIGNKDSVGDIIIPGAFAKSLQHRQPRVVWGHDWNSPIGKVIEIEEIPPTDPRIPEKMKAMNVGGLYVKVQFNLGSSRGKEAFNDVLFYGKEQEWSIGYKTIRKTYDPERAANILQEVELYEVSPVLHGANNLTSTISIKDDDADDLDVKDNNLWVDTTGTDWSSFTAGNTGQWNSSGVTGASWNFQIDDKMMHVSGEHTHTGPMQPPVPLEESMESKLKKTFMSAFGPLSDLKLMDGNQAIFKRGDAMWAVKYRIEGPKLIVTRPKKVRVRTIIEPIMEQPSMVGPREEGMIVRKESDEDPADLYKSLVSEVLVKISVEMDESSVDEVKSILSGLESKAGRVISQGNMDKLGKAAGMIQEVISAGTREAVAADERVPMMKKDIGDSIIVTKGANVSGKVVRLTSKDETVDLGKVEALLDALEPLAEKYDWTLLSPSQKSIDDGTCSLGIYLSSDDNMNEQVKSLSEAIKSSDCNIVAAVEEEEFYGDGVKPFDEVFPTE